MFSNIQYPLVVFLISLFYPTRHKLSRTHILIGVKSAFKKIKSIKFRILLDVICSALAAFSALGQKLF